MNRLSINKGWLKWSYLFILLIILGLNLALTGFFKDFIRFDHVWIYFLLKGIFFLIGIIYIAKFLHYIAGSKSISQFFKNILTSFFALGLVLHVIEFAFVFIPISNHTQLSLVSWTWEVYYNSDNNELGFRDREVANRINNNKTKIFFIGDSYTEGFGLKRNEYRYSNKVAAKLGASFEVFNFGKSGISTKEEFENLKKIPFKPDIIVWQYFFNDLQDVCISQLNYFPDLNEYEDINFISAWLIKRSYLLNYLFYKFYPLEIYDDYTAFFKTCALDAGTQEKYFQLLTEIKDYCELYNVKLIFMVIPIPVKPEDSSKQDDLMVNYLKALNIPVLIPKNDLMAIPEESRVVSEQDMHLSKESNELLANMIYSALKKL